MITENYIKICGQAEEIQEVWRNPFRNKFGDLYWRGNKYLMIPEACILNTDSHLIPEEEVWLPTLEQLFEMVDWDKAINNSTNIINNTWKRECREGCKLYLLFNFYKDGISNRFDTIKEILFAFVMREKYKKIWTGEKWINK